MNSWNERNGEDMGKAVHQIIIWRFERTRRSIRVGDARSQRACWERMIFYLGSRCQAWVPKRITRELFKSSSLNSHPRENLILVGLGGVLGTGGFKSSPRGFWCALKIENHCFRLQSAFSHIIEGFVHLKRGKGNICNACWLYKEEEEKE